MNGKIGTPATQTAGTAFNVSVNAVDAFWNLITNVTDTVGLTSSDGNASLPANAALLGGTKTLSVTLKTAGSATVTATDATDGSKTAHTSSSVNVVAGALSKLQLLTPGETAAPGTAAGKTGAPSAQTAGTAFSVTVNAVDANWNVVSTNDTVAITSSDANAALPSNAALTNGTKSFSVTLKTAGSATLTASDTSHPSYASATSPAITVNAGAFTKLQLLVPGESASPGTATGKTGAPTARTADAAFNVTVNAVDANWNVVTNVAHTVALTSSDANAGLPSNASLTNGTQTFSLTLKTAGSATATASDITDGSKTASTSPAMPVSAGAFTKLQLLVPGEVAAPGSASGKTGNPSAQSAGIAFSAAVNAVDANWNLVTNVTHTVALTSSDSNATLPASAALVSGTKNFSVTLMTLGAWTVTSTDATDGSKSANTSPAITTGVGAARKLTIQTQPSSTATAGAAFAQQPVIRVEDVGGNLVTNDTGRVITAARAAGTGALQGTLTATTVNGVATFADLSYNVAEALTLNFTTTGLTNTTSGNVAVSPALADHLTFTTQPGGVSRAGSALATQPVIRSQDQFGNNSVAGLPSSLPVTFALTSGSGSLLGTTSFDLGTAAGNGLVTCTNLQCSSAGTNKQLTASAAGLTSAVSGAFNIGGVEAATGGSAISADTVGGAYTTLSGPIYYEAASADAGAGTIILNPPTGFIFDTNAPAPQVIITRLTGSSANTDNINDVASGTAAAVTSRATNQITFTVSAASSNGVTCSLTWTNVRVRPLSGTPLASGNLTKSGTATMQVVTTGSTSFGTLTEVAGLANRLAFTTQPASSTAGAPLTTQPVVRARDQFGNNSTSGLAASKIVSLTLSAGTGPLLGTTNLDIGTSAGNGVVTFTNLEIDSAATNKQITASANGFTNAVSSTFTISAGAANKLTIQTQPSASATAGAVFAQQPVIRIEDAFGNLRSTDNSTVVTVTRATGTGTLLGTTSRTAVNGVVTFTNLSYNTAETITLSFASGGLTGATSSSVVVSAAAANRLTIQTQPSASAIAGAVFAQQPVIRVEDQFGNLRLADNATIVTATRAAGGGVLQGTTSVTAVNGVVSFASLSHNVATNITIQFTSGSLSNTTSSAIAVSAANASKLVFTAQPGSATAGSAFGIQPALKTQDQFNNDSTAGLPPNLDVTLALTSGTGPLQGTASRDIGTAAGNGVVTFTGLEIDAAGTNKQLTASASGLSSAVSSVFTVSAAAADHLAMQTQPSATANAGAVFAQQPVIRIEDAFGNLRSGDNATVVTASRATGSAALQGTTNRTAINGLVTFTNLSYNVAETITLGFASGSLTGTASSNVVVSAGAASRLTIQMQPSPTATAGVVFAQQPVIRVEDQFGNLRSGDSTTIVTATRSAGNGTLQGTTIATAANGVVTFANLAHNVATNITIQFTSGSLSNTTSSAVAVSPGAFTKLQLLVPGEIADPATASGKTGTPGAQSGNTSFNVTVNAVDANWNLVNTVTDLVGITSSDAAATLPGNLNLVSGTRQFGVALNTVGSATVTASDLSDNTKTASTSPAITVTAPNYTVATGGSAISADATGGTYTNLTGPIYTEKANGNVGTGTIILKAPTGFVFDTGGTAPTVRIDSSGASSKNINGATSGSSLAMTSVTATQLTFTVTVPSSGGVLCTMTWQNVRVRPSAGTPLANGNLTVAGTASLATVTTNSNFGTLREVVGGARKLVMQSQPSATATAGVPFAQQPVIQVQDQFGNFRTNDSTTVVSASRSAGSGTLQGTTNRTAVAGLVTFTNLSHNLATNVTVLFASSGLTNVTSTSIAVSPATATALAFATQPGNATAGAAFGTQPVLKSQDAFGNNSTVGLPANLNVTLDLTSGAGPLQGTTSFDIGSAAGNGVANFSNLRIDAAGTNKQLTASATGLSSIASGVFTVNVGAASRLTIQTQPSSSAIAGTAFAQQPVIRVEDAFGNLRSSDNTTVVTVARNLGTGTLSGTTTATASGGIVSFANLSYAVAETMNLSFTSGALTGAVSSDVTVSPATANRLTILTQPSGTATAGIAFAQQPVIRIEDQYGNLRSADNSTVVTATRSVGTGTLQGTTTATASGGVASFGNLNYPAAETMKIVFSAGGLTNATSSNVVVSAGAFTKLQVLVPGETAAPGTISGKTGSPALQFLATPFNVSVLAVDDYWNVVNTVTDVVALSSSDPLATIPANAALVSGTKQFSVTLNSTGTNTVTAADVTDNSKAAATSAGITINARYTPAIGGGAISADTTGGAFTSLVGPSYSEFASGEVGTGTIILNAPTGFIFDTGGTAPTVLITRLGGSGGNTNNINDVASGTAAAITSRATNQITFTVTGASALGVTCQLTWQNVRVRPTAGAPLVVTNLTKSGTATIAGLTNTISNLGMLRENAGAANRLAILTQPSSTATAGVAFAQQPVVCVKDQFGNLLSAANGSADNATVVTATRVAGSGVLQGATNVVASDGLVAFTDLSHTVATNITISFTSGSLAGTNSTTIAISPASATQLTFTTQPANGTVGVPLATQPVVRTCDAFGNKSVVGLGANQIVSLALSAGSGSLSGTMALDIGTSAGNGAVSFSNLGVTAAGTDKQLTASASGLSDAVSGIFSVAKGNQTITFGALGNKTYGDAAFALSATASSGLAVSFSVVSGPATISGTTLTITGAGTVTVRASQAGDANWNTATPMDRSFTVAKASLTITADNQTRTYGAANPSLTVSYNGFVNGEDASVLTGSPVLSTTATPASPVSGSPYPITVAAGTLASANYSFSFIAGSLTVTKATLTLTADDKSRAYGTTNPPFTFKCTGFVNGENETVLIGSPALSSSATASSPVPGNPYPITITPGTSSASNYDCVFVDGKLTIGKATLTVTADDQARVYGAPNPAFTATYSGFVNGENASVLSGGPDLNSTATTTSSVAGSPYAINASKGALDSANYDFNFVAGSLTITPASLTGALVTSANPSPTGSNVTFTLTLNAVAPSAGIPTGAVQFIADGAPSGSPAGLSSGVASLTTSSLSHGLHSIAAAYAGDGNFRGVTNDLAATQMINSAPLATSATYLRSSNFWVKIPIPDLLTNRTSDADGDARTLVSVGAGTNGATILVFGDGVYYLPSDSDPNRNTPDHFDYTVTDGFAGCLATNQICVRVNAPSNPGTNSPPPSLTSLTVVQNGIKIAFSGVAGNTYHVERAALLAGDQTAWVDLGAATLDEVGQGEFTDTNAPPSAAFYRLAWP
ncbi:MAG: Ig-like domain repeat protein [Verrucomicrobia bacterium]|nr:MAG: Ig-like domain repeat protein [Verrucomicrobiota bacterium]